jgi:hypothetical protein
VDVIYDDVYNSLPPPPSEDTSLDWFAITTNALDVTSAVAGIADAGELSAALSLASIGVGLAQDFMQTDDGGTADSVDVDAPDELAAQLAQQQSAAVEGIDRMETILLSDYGRLAAVGIAAGGADPSWAWTPDTTIDGIHALNAGTRAASYTTLIPEIYRATDLEPNDDNGPTTPPRTTSPPTSAPMTTARSTTRYRPISSTPSPGSTRPPATSSAMCGPSPTTSPPAVPRCPPPH